MRPKIYLKKHEENRVKSGHPWIFSNEINSIEGTCRDGDIVDVCDFKKKYVGTGYFNSHSLITVRILSREDTAIDRTFLFSRIMDALNYRYKITGKRDAFRIIFSESDFLPGLIVDKYGKFLVMQFLTLGIDKFMNDILDIFRELLSPAAIILRNDSPFRKLEGIKQEKIILGGIQKDELRNVSIDEGSVQFKVDLWDGQKTGFFLDQRVNRDYFSSLNLSGKGLDCFCYSGAWALRSGNKSYVTCIDASDSAIALAEANAAKNLCSDKMEFIKEDVFDFLSSCIAKKKFFDWIVLDPPAFVKNKKKVKEAIAGYRELNLRAMKLLLPGGILITSSCSHNLREDVFFRILKEASGEAKREARIIACGNQSPDHPVLLSMPESKYLKCIFMNII
ncbi:MAG: class I SAM-dependent rRNA methyltransferase [Candidatus Eremiobacterota bacterium]